jgi:hypothetical protein
LSSSLTTAKKRKRKKEKKSKIKAKDWMEAWFNWQNIFKHFCKALDSIPKGEKPNRALMKDLQSQASVWLCCLSSLQ